MDRSLITAGQNVVDDDDAIVEVQFARNTQTPLSPILCVVDSFRQYDDLSETTCHCNRASQLWTRFRIDIDKDDAILVERCIDLTEKRADNRCISIRLGEQISVIDINF